jgi:hypothetical protein
MNGEEIMKPRPFAFALATTALALAAFLLALPTSPPSGDAWAAGSEQEIAKVKSRPAQPTLADHRRRG